MLNNYFYEWKKDLVKYIGDLFEELDRMGYESIAGPVRNAIPLVILKDYFYDRLTDPIPQKYIDLYRLNDEIDPDDPNLERLDGEIDGDD